MADLLRESLEGAAAVLARGPNSLPHEWNWSALWDHANFRWTVDGDASGDAPTPMSDPWWAVFSIVLYLVVVFSLKAWMRGREAYTLTGAMFLHNLILFVWSLGMFAGAVLFGMERIAARGYFTVVFCESDIRQYRGSLIWVTYMFYISKYWELLDTVIIVLKKRDLLFLQWYHHAAAVILSWNNLESVWPQFWFCVAGNALIHTFMYFYYSCAALKIRQVMWFRQYLTSLQLLQFMVFLTTGVANLVLLVFYKEYGCLGDVRAPILNMLWILTLIYLFSQFYKQNYSAKKKGKKD